MRLSGLLWLTMSTRTVPVSGHRYTVPPVPYYTPNKITYTILLSLLICSNPYFFRLHCTIYLQYTITIQFQMFRPIPNQIRTRHMTSQWTPRGSLTLVSPPSPTTYTARLIPMLGSVTRHTGIPARSSLTCQTVPWLLTRSTYWTRVWNFVLPQGLRSFPTPSRISMISTGNFAYVIISMVM